MKNGNHDNHTRKNRYKMCRTREYHVSKNLSFGGGGKQWQKTNKKQWRRWHSTAEKN